MSLPLSLAILTTLASPLLAQTFTSCNPLNSTCPPDTALGITNATYDFLTSKAGSTWNTTDGDIVYGTSGAEFSISSKGDAPTIQSNFYIFFGEVEVWLKAAPGQGVVSTVVLESDDLDEIDWEIIGSNTTHAENNYYGKGNTTDAYERAKWYPMTQAPQDGFHNYTTRWTNETLEWYIDGAVVRTLNYNDANGGQSFPQTPMNVRIGVWAAGDPSNSNYTVAWAGGEIDYSKGPYTMYVQSARITDYSSGAEYKYGDGTGSWQSIDIIPGNSSVADTLAAPPPVSLAQHWANLSSGAKIGVYAGISAVIALVLASWAFCCVKHRKAGKKEGAMADALYEKDTAELMAHRSEMGQIRGGLGSRTISDY